MTSREYKIVNQRECEECKVSPSFSGFKFCLLCIRKTIKRTPYQTNQELLFLSGLNISFLLTTTYTRYGQDYLTKFRTIGRLITQNVSRLYLEAVIENGNFRDPNLQELELAKALGIEI